MTDIDIAAIKARADRARPGPWFRKDEHVIADDDHARLISTVCDWDDVPQQYRDAEFIAHAREDVPALIAEVERLRAAVDATAADTQRYVADHLADARVEVERLSAQRQTVLDLCDRAERIAQRWAEDGSGRKVGWAWTLDPDGVRAVYGADQ
jgi:hypothetical protein